MPPLPERIIPLLSEPDAVFCDITALPDVEKEMFPPIERDFPTPKPPCNVTDAFEGVAASRVEEQEKAMTDNEPGRSIPPEALFTTSGTIVFRRILDMIIRANLNVFHKILNN